MLRRGYPARTDKFKVLSLVLLGIVLGLGYSVACGSGKREQRCVVPMIPGVDVAMAQGGCAQWEVVNVDGAYFVESGKLPQADGSYETPIYAVPAGWTPLSGGASFGEIWIARCVP